MKTKPEIVLTKKEIYCLGIWCSTQRQNFKNNNLSQKNIAKLNSIGFVWDTMEYRWNKHFEELLIFKEKHGHIDAPRPELKEGTTLGTWINNQRVAFKKNTLSQSQIDKLNSIGFVWKRLESKWDKSFRELLIFKKKHGHVNVPHTSDDTRTAVGTWVIKQRQYFKENKLSQERINKLNSIGFLWDPKETLWNVSFEKLITFQKKHGHLNVSRLDEKDKALASWVVKQRMNFDNNILLQERIDKLNEIGFVWRIRTKRTITETKE